tara:strand:- start:212 stop:523 length:312 start_codon:yes stop_codon:yes gene_type:complete
MKNTNTNREVGLFPKSFYPLLLIAAIITFAIICSGCSKEEEPKADAVDCNCGIAEYRGGAWDLNGRQVKWSYIVRNNCTNAPLGLNYLSSPLTSETYCLNYQW